MTAIVAEATLTPMQLKGYLERLERQGWAYSLVHEDTVFTSSGPQLIFYLCCDGSLHNGTRITLNGDGTFSVTTEVCLGETSE